MAKTKDAQHSLLTLLYLSLEREIELFDIWPKVIAIYNNFKQKWIENVWLALQTEKEI